MATASAAYTLHFLEGFDDRVEAEMIDKGYLPGTVVELADGSRHELTFYDAVRLAQNADRLAARGIPLVVDASTVVVPEVTVDAIQAAVEHLILHARFGRLRPLAP